MSTRKQIKHRKRSEWKTIILQTAKEKWVHPTELLIYNAGQNIALTDRTGEDFVYLYHDEISQMLEALYTYRPKIIKAFIAKHVAEVPIGKLADRVWQRHFPAKAHYFVGGKSLCGIVVDEVLTNKDGGVFAHKDECEICYKLHYER